MSHLTKTLLIGLVLAVVAAACSSDQPAATVNGEPIAMGEVVAMIPGAEDASSVDAEQLRGGVGLMKVLQRGRLEPLGHGLRPLLAGDDLGAHVEHGLANLHGPAELAQVLLERLGEGEVHVGDPGRQDVVGVRRPLLSPPRAQSIERQVVEFHSGRSLTAWTGDFRC